jgi:hypothetical protein
MGANIYSSELGVKICGSELPATSAQMARHLGAKNYDAETCYLGATSSSADPLGPKMSLYLLRGQT